MRQVINALLTGVFALASLALQAASRPDTTALRRIVKYETFVYTDPLFYTKLEEVEFLT